MNGSFHTAALNQLACEIKSKGGISVNVSGCMVGIVGHPEVIQISGKST